MLARQGRFVEAGEARAQLGYLLLKHRKYDAAVALFQKEVGVRPGDAAAHNNLGAALLLRGDVGPAIEHFEESLRLDPGPREGPAKPRGGPPAPLTRPGRPRVAPGPVLS